MKKIIIILIVLATAITSGNAQFFVEGSVGVQYWGESASLDGISLNNPNRYFLNLSPLVGYQMNENLAFGVKASFIRHTENFIIPDPNTGDDVLLERKLPGWGLAAFDRYKLWGTKKFSLLLESSLGISEYHNVSSLGTMTTVNVTRSSIGVNAFPMISYDLSDRFSIIVSCDFLSLSLYRLTVENKNTGLEEKSWHFDFNAQSTIPEYLRNIGFGVIFHFKKSNK